MIMSCIFKGNMWTWTETIKLKDECKALKQLQSDISVVILPAEKVDLLLSLTVRTIWKNEWII